MSRRGKKQDARAEPPAPEAAAPELLVEDPVLTTKRPQIVYLLERSSVLVLKLTNSAAKSWQMPEIIYETYIKVEGTRMLVTTQTKEEALAAARSLSLRLKSPLGALVGYDVDQERKTSRDTLILYMTARGFADKFARTTEKQPIWRYILMDDFNRRSLEDEIAVKLIQKSKNTKLVLMLSEADVNIFSVFLKKTDEEAERVVSWAEQPRIALPEIEKPANPEPQSGNQIYDVKPYYLGNLFEKVNELKGLYEEPAREIFRGNGDDRLTGVSEILMKIALAVVEKQLKEALWAQAGSSILVYLPNLDLCKQLRAMVTSNSDIDPGSYSPLILQTTIPDRRQHEILKDSQNLLIFTTTMIENTIKIPTLRIVIDFGLTLERSQDEATLLEEEIIKWASKSLIRQRSSRVERYKEGVIFRLMPEGFFQYQLYDYSKPEIHRFPLDKLMLKLRQTGVGNITSLFENKDFQPLELKEIEKAEEHLSSQGALSDAKEVTWVGQVYLHMPCNLRLTRLCLFGAVFGCMEEAVTIAAILAQNKGLFRSFKYETFLDAQKEVQVQQAKMRWDSESDMIGTLRLFHIWLHEHGSKVNAFLQSNPSNSLSRPGPSSEETRWCADNFVDAETLRDVIVARNDMKRALVELGISPKLLATSIDVLGNDGLWPLQLCIAGALTGNYLMSDYMHKDEAGRERISQKAGRDTKDTLLIEQVSDAVNSADLEKLFRSTWPEVRIRASIMASNAIISFQGADNKAIRMALWISHCSMRHKKGFFVIMKDRVRKRTDESRILESTEVPKDRWAEILRNFPTGQSRVGIRHQVRPEVFEHTIQATEVYFVPRPLYAHQLVFGDLATRHDVLISEDSVAYQVIETDPVLRKSHLGVFFQYEYTRIGRKPIAKYVTLMPVRPLMPQLISLIFCSDVELFTEGSKYAGIKFKHSAERIPFDFNFNSLDLAEINDIRQRISAALTEERFKRGDIDSNLVSAIWQLVCKPRLQKVYEMRQWELLLNDDNRQIMQVTDNAPLSHYFSLLPPIPPLDVQEDLESGPEEQTESMRKRKQKVLDDIMLRVKQCEVMQTELVCETCKNCITIADMLEVVEENPGKPAVLELRNTFGTVNLVDSDNEIEGNKWATAFKAKHMGEKYSWLACNLGHIFGYHFFGVDYYESTSPVKLRFPTLKEARLKPDLWANECEGLQKLTEKYRAEQRKMPIDLNCSICDIELESRKAFTVHVRTDREHKVLVGKFMEDVVS